MIYAKNQLNWAHTTVRAANFAERNDQPATKPPLDLVPFALFGLHNAWARNAPSDRRIIRLADGTVRLNYGVTGATPNSNEVGASFATSAARAGLKTIMFVNQADHAPTTAKKIKAGIPAVGALTELENDLWQDIIAELGGAQHSLLDPTAPALPHNGDMISIERRMAESLFRRRDGASVIVATPTLAQGMNLPAEVAILAGTMRHDEDGREPLKGHEILNAAGRAGRAGHLANGTVLLIPEPPVSFETDWTPTGEAFAMLAKVLLANDQCVMIDDPLTALLDRIQLGAPRQGAATQSGRETVLGTVMMLVGQNSREVALRVQDALPDIQGALPKGMVVHQQYSRSDLVDRTISTVEHNLGEGALLVALVLLVVMGNWRAAAIVTLVIPLAFLVTVSGMNAIGLSGNLMSLGALDFGLIVDGSIVVVENSLRLLANRRRDKSEDLTPEERRATVAEAARMVARPTMFGIAIIALVYVPVLSLGGVEGKLFQPMAQAVMLAILAGLIWTFTIVPALSAWLLRAPASEREDSRHKGLIGLAERGYAPALERAIAHPLLLMIGALILLGTTFMVFRSLGSQFTPQLDEGSITAMVYRPVGMSLDRSLAIEQETERQIRRQFPQVTHTFSRIGTSEVATDPMPPNENDLYIFYAPEKSWPQGDGRPKTKDELVAGIEKIGRQVYRGQTFEFAQPIEMRFNETLEGVRADVSVKIFGENYDVLENAAQQAKIILEKQPGTAGVEFETAGRPKSVAVELDHAAMLRLGLDTAEVNKAITDAIAGAEVGFIPEGEARHMIVVRMREGLRSDPAAILALPLRVGDYGIVPLARVARLHEVRAVEPILHDSGKRRAALMVSLKTSDLAGYVQKARAAVIEQVKLPPGYRIEFGGQFHQLEAAQKRLSIVVPAALILIFLLVYAALGSVKEAAIVYTGIPFAVTGGVLALWLRGMPFSITAAIGFIALSGIAMLNGLVLIDHINALRDGRDGDPLPLDDAVRQGARDRLRPVLSTALVAAIGFVPMAIASGAGAEVQRPLATVVIGGIVTSTILTLLLLPSLYRLLAGTHPERGNDAATPAPNGTR